MNRVTEQVREPSHPSAGGMARPVSTRWTVQFSGSSSCPLHGPGREVDREVARQRRVVREVLLHDLAPVAQGDDEVA